GRRFWNAGEKPAAASATSARAAPPFHRYSQTCCKIISRRTGLNRPALLPKRNIQHPPAFAFCPRLILKKAKEERALFGIRADIAPVEVPQQRLAGCASFRIMLRTPKGPKRRIVPLDALAGGQEGLEDGPNLQTAVAVKLTPRRE